MAREPVAVKTDDVKEVGIAVHGAPEGQMQVRLAYRI